jgi:hypothetical protein
MAAEAGRGREVAVLWSIAVGQPKAQPATYQGQPY